MPIDLKKEIKLSELFRRKAKTLAQVGAAKAHETEKAPKPERSFRRRPTKAPKVPGVAGTPVAVPQIPLMRAFNLLPRDESSQGREGRPSIAQVGVALAGLVVFAALGGFFLLTSADVSDKKSTHDELRVRLAALEIPQKDPSQPALRNERSTRAAALAGALATRVAWDRLLRELSLVLPESVSLTSLQAKAPAAAAGSPTSFMIGGYTTDQDGVAELLGRLSVLPELSTVQLVSAASSGEGAAETVQFTINAAVR